MLSPYIDEIIGDDQGGFQSNRSTADQIFSILQLFIHFKEGYDLVLRGVLYNILNEVGILMKLVKLIKMRGTCSKAHTDIFLILFLFSMVGSKEMLYHHCFSTSIHH
jgi:hypothetical protein